jgi:hypothetical protein
VLDTLTFRTLARGPVEVIRSLETAHESAAHDRVEAINQFKSMMFRAPNSFRDVFSPRVPSGTPVG